MNCAGNILSFDGIIIEYSLSEAALVQSKDAFTIFNPSDFVDIKHNFMYSQDQVDTVDMRSSYCVESI